MNWFKSSFLTTLGALALIAPLAQQTAHSQGALIPNQLSTSVVPAIGDVNPYGVAFVPPNFAAGGSLNPGDILVSNYNSAMNLQGTGTTIVKVTPAGQTSLFFQGQIGMGLDTALGFLKHGFVLVGNVPTADGTFATIQQGSLLILDKNGNQVAALTDPNLLNGPWDLTIHDLGGSAQVFISCVLSGTITRLDLKVQPDKIVVEKAVQIGSGFMHRGDPAALVVGPAGLAYDSRNDLLYVASSGDNEIFAISDAGHRHTDGGTGQLIYQDNVHLHGPLGLALAPNGHLITANSDAVNADPAQPSEIVEFTRTGQFVSQFSVNPNGVGGTFGVAVTIIGDDVCIAAVDDLINQLHVWMIDRR